VKQKILLVFGTRPEAIKMLPVAAALEREAALSVSICVTAQHRQMLDQVFEAFEKKPDYDLNLMTQAQGLEQITAVMLTGLSKALDEIKPDRVLVHGDTTTTMVASLAAFYKKIPVSHIEAGLRSGDLYQPWPEELNRRLTDVIADQFFAPTAGARDNLLRENVAAERIHVTGNTGIDALRSMADKIKQSEGLQKVLSRNFQFLDPKRPLLLVTGHRRENFGLSFENVCHAIKDLARAHPIQVVYPVHLNPNVQGVVKQMLGEISNVHLIAPQDYLPFVYLMSRSYVILTDSGGIQEEGPTLGKPVFVMRNVTERPEAIEAGTACLVGTDRTSIFTNVSRVLGDRAAYDQMSRAHNPYGDGRASQRIADILVGRKTSEFKS
jgi:UDP-N-acetylglucosamine 2-epimerase